MFVLKQLNTSPTAAVLWTEIAWIEIDAVGLMFSVCERKFWSLQQYLQEIDI